MDFGTPVLMSARSARIVAEANGLAGFVHFSHGGGAQDRNRYVHEEQYRWPVHVQTTWPGSPIPLAPCPPIKGLTSYDLEAVPDAKYPVVRIRRLDFDEPVAGIVIGSCFKHEGVRNKGWGYDEPGSLLTLRRVPLYEIACGTDSKATIYLAWEDDIQPA